MAPAGAAQAQLQLRSTDAKHIDVISRGVVYRGALSRLFGRGGGYIQTREVELLLGQIEV